MLLAVNNIQSFQHHLQTFLVSVCNPFKRYVQASLEFSPLPTGKFNQQPGQPSPAAADRLFRQGGKFGSAPTGALDALTLLSAGFDDVVATMGIRGFNDAQLSQLLEHGVRRVYIAFDNTPSADHYALLVAQALDAVGIKCYRIKLPLGQDVNRFALTEKSFAYTFCTLMEEAQRLKQHVGGMTRTPDTWQTRLDTLSDCLEFYLDEACWFGKSPRERISELTPKGLKGHTLLSLPRALRP